MKLDISIIFTIQEIIFGYLQKDTNYDLINLLVSCTKKYIFHCAVNYKKVNIFVLQTKMGPVCVGYVPKMKKVLFIYSFLVNTLNIYGVQSPLG